MIKGQDILVLASLMGDGAGVPYAELSKKAKLSVSETHAAVKRLQGSGLVNGERRVVRRNALEFLVHGLKYAFPMKAAGEKAKGMPTGYAAPVARREFASAGMAPVWKTSGGEVYGRVFEPIYETAPQAAEEDEGMYERLALFDMLRGGKLRERMFAENRLQEMMA